MALVRPCGNCGQDSTYGALIHHRQRLVYRFCAGCWEKMHAAFQEAGTEYVPGGNPNEWWAGGNPWPP
jgi:hypothetical protein